MTERRPREDRETSLKNMRKFYDNWKMLDADTSVATDDSQSTIAIVESSQESAVATAECSSAKSAVVTAELQKTQNQIDIYHSIYVPNVTEFPVEDFFAVPFTHHISLIEKTKDLEARYYYIHRTAVEKLSVDALERLIKQQAYEKQEQIPNNFKQTLSGSALALTLARLPILGGGRSFRFNGRTLRVLCYAFPKNLNCLGTPNEIRRAHGTKLPACLRGIEWER